MPSLKSKVGSRDFISLDDVCNLLSSVTTGHDNLGQPIIKEKPFMVFCSKLSITAAGAGRVKVGLLARTTCATPPRSFSSRSNSSRKNFQGATAKG